MAREIKIVIEYPNGKHKAVIVKSVDEAFRLCRHELPTGYDLICIPRRGVFGTLADYQNSLKRLAGMGAKRFDRMARHQRKRETGA